ncbi:hypothetical protein GCM10027612_69310 [Microbispora bryophytorum subsp. camponoti]
MPYVGAGPPKPSAPLKLSAPPTPPAPLKPSAFLKPSGGAPKGEVVRDRSGAPKAVKGCCGAVPGTGPAMVAVASAGCCGAPSTKDRTVGVKDEGGGTSGQAGGISGHAGSRWCSLRSVGTVPPEIMPELGVPGMISCAPGAAAAKPRNASRNCSPVGSVGGSCIGKSSGGNELATEAQ